MLPQWKSGLTKWEIDKASPGRGEFKKMLELPLIPSLLLLMDEPGEMPSRDQLGLGMGWGGVEWGRRHHSG